MVRRVKIWEGQHSVSVTGEPTKPVERAITSMHRSDQPATRKICPRCGQSNPTGELFCTNCGSFLSSDTSPHETTRLDDSEHARPSERFLRTRHSILVLVVMPEGEAYTIQPQRFKHETVIGRSEGSTMRPDIDLSAHNAGEMGVSRLHVALQYSAKNNLLSVSDMKSANGTFINGQKLYPQEVRVLRDGDELRLGRLVMRVYFQHPAQSPDLDDPAAKLRHPSACAKRLHALGRFLDNLHKQRLHQAVVDLIGTAIAAVAQHFTDGLPLARTTPD